MAQPLDPREALMRCGGVASVRQLLALTSARRLRTAEAREDVLRVSRGHYALPGAARHWQQAAQLNGTLSHLSAAQHWGWPVKQPPQQAWVTVPRGRKVRIRHHSVLRHADLGPEDLDPARPVTSPLRTVLDCARQLPFDQALCVVDSALRAGLDPDEVRRASDDLRGPGSAAARRVVMAADARAANPFESTLRALVLQEGSLEVEPQLSVETIGLTYHPDLVDQHRRVVVEAESFTWHADGIAFARDCLRYNLLAAAGYVVLRFTWADVMRSPDHVRRVLAAVARQRQGAAVGQGR